MACMVRGSFFSDRYFQKHSKARKKKCTDIGIKSAKCCPVRGPDTGAIDGYHSHTIIFLFSDLKLGRGPFANTAFAQKFKKR